MTMTIILRVTKIWKTLEQKPLKILNSILLPNKFYTHENTQIPLTQLLKLRDVIQDVIKKGDVS